MLRNFVKNQDEKGFTLVEMIMVIVILGVLASFAMPRMPKWNSAARTSAINGMLGTLHSASALAHATQLVNGGAHNTVISIDNGPNIKMVYDYPGSTFTGGMDNAIQESSGFTLQTGASAVTQLPMEFRLTSATSPQTCYAAYREPQSATAGPTFSTNTAGC